VKDKSSWRKVHEFFGTEWYADRALYEYDTGRIDYLQFMEHDISKWPKGIRGTTIEHILSRSVTTEGAKSLFAYLKNNGYKTAIISSGLSGLAKRVARELEADFCLANDVQLNDNGSLTGKGVLVVDPKKKGAVLSSLMKEFGLERNNVMSVGDSRFDISFFSVAGVSVAINPPPEDLDIILGVVNFVVNDLSDVENIIDILP
jgi:phosphoserine phosphatase